MGIFEHLNRFCVLLPYSIMRHLVLLLLPLVYADLFWDKPEASQDELAKAVERVRSYVEINTTDYKNTTLLRIMHNGNASAINQITDDVFQRIDADGNGRITEGEMILYVGQQRNISIRRLNPVAQHALYGVFKLYDTDGNGQISHAEFFKKVFDASQVAIQVPNNYEMVCDAFMNAARDCSNRTQTPLTDFEQKMNVQYQLCYSGYSLFVEKFQVEECVLKNSRGPRCVRRIEGCFELQDDQPKLSTMSLSGATAGSQGVSVDSAASISVTNAWWAVNNPMYGQVAKTLAPILVVLIIAAVAGIVIVTLKRNELERLDKFWLTQTKYERWQLGMPELPANTVFIYWSDSCGVLRSEKSRYCPRGQLFDLYGCYRWSVYGRSCFLFGCQPLCIDIAKREGVPQLLKLGYDSRGQTIVVSIKD